MVALGHERLPVRHAGLRLKRGSTHELFGCALTAAALAAAAACAAPRAAAPGEVAFESAVVWIRQGTDSTHATVEVAETRAQHEVGLAGRATLEPASGMLFLFDPPRSADDGFWMWRTGIPLDIAYIGADGVIHGIQSMDPCTAASRDDCPGYFPDAPYTAALEMGRGWFSRSGIRVGAVVRVER